MSGALLLLGVVTLFYSCQYFQKGAGTAPAVGPYPEKVSLPVMLGVRLAPIRGGEQIAVKGEYTIETLDNRLIQRGSKLAPSAIRVGEGKPMLAGTAMPQTGFRVMPLRDGTLRFGSRGYRGSLLVVPVGGTFEAINRVSLESCVRGLVGQEMSPSWSSEALKAQAVAARTYAFEHWVRMHDRARQLNEYSMAYRGMSAESISTDRAVRETEGIVMVYDSRPFEAFFSSTCGGHTSSIQFVHNQREVPPLAGVKCDYCKGSPYYGWSNRVSASHLTASLAGEGVGEVTSLKPVETDKAGRSHFILVNDTVRIDTTRFRKLVGYDKMKSALFTVERSGTDFVFAGRGWGHGVGMCQYGARAMATQGMGWYDILVYYYPSCQLVRLQ